MAMTVLKADNTRLGPVMTTCMQHACKKALRVANCSCCPVKFGLVLSSCACAGIKTVCISPACFSPSCVCEFKGSYFLKCSEGPKVLHCSASPLTEYCFISVQNFFISLHTNIQCVQDPTDPQSLSVTIGTCLSHAVTTI